MNEIVHIELTATQSAVLQLLRQSDRPLTVVDDLAFAGVPGVEGAIGYAAANKAIHRLVDLGLVRRLPGQPFPYEEVRRA